MKIYTKSAQAPKSSEDGIRICVMKKPGPEVEFDIWMPVLSPMSMEIINIYQSGGISWEEFSAQFKAEILKPNTVFLHIINDIAAYNTVTIVCWEPSGQRCHRRLVAEGCQALNSAIDIYID